LGFGFGFLGLGLGPQTPNPQSPIPNPQSPIPNPHVLQLYYIILFLIYYLFSLFLIFFLMENTGLLIIDINEGKKKDIIKYDSIINKESIEEFNSSLKSLFSKDINEIRNKNIFINFVKKYAYSRNINYLLKRRDKLISENKIPIKFISYLYSYVLYYIFVHYKYINLMDNKKLYAPSKFFDLVTKLFKSNFTKF